LEVEQKVEVGRLRLRWHEYARNDLRETEVKGWEKADMREEWAFVIKEIKVLRGAESRGRSTRCGCI
jgi:hypothetical protein